jgi:hypothetical protein
LPRLTVPYLQRAPILGLALRGPARTLAVAGVVDSGADRTLLPRSLALELGVRAEDFEPTPAGSGGAGGSWFPTWTASHPLRARVVPFGEATRNEPWGPEFELWPEYAADTIPLFGRADFFESFAVTFDQPGGQGFHLDY